MTADSYLGPERTNVSEVWADYIHPERLGERLLLTITPILFYFLLRGSLMHAFGVPAVPYRGQFAYLVDTLMGLLCEVSLLILLVFVVQETSRTLVFVRRLSRPSVWPPAVLEKFGQNSAVADRHPGLANYLEDWVEIDLIGRRTEVVTPLIYYPCFVTALLILARNPIFDNWSTPLFLIVGFGLVYFIALLASLMLRSAAENARAEALENLTNKLQRAEQVGEGRIAAEIRILIDRTRSTMRGGFRPFTQQPWLKVVLVLLGSLSASPLVEFLLNKH